MKSITNLQLLGGPGSSHLAACKTYNNLLHLDRADLKILEYTPLLLMGLILSYIERQLVDPTERTSKYFCFLWKLGNLFQVFRALFSLSSPHTHTSYFLAYCVYLAGFLGTVPSWFNVCLLLSIVSLILFWKWAFYKLLMIIIVLQIPLCFWNLETKSEQWTQWVITKNIKAIPNA